MAQDIPASVGWLTVTAEGITALADSIDVGDVPDSRPMVGTVDFTAPVPDGMVVAIGESPAKLVALSPIKCEFDENGVMRPPRDGRDSTLDEGGGGGIDPAGNVRIVAPDQPDSLSVFGWTWTATFKPSSGQKWKQFTVNFGGAPNDTINLADKYAEQKAARAGAYSPMIHKVPGPYTPGDPLPEGIKPGMYVLDESTGNIYLVADDSTVGFFTTLPGYNVEFTDGVIAQAVTAGGDTETALNAKIASDTSHKAPLASPALTGAPTVNGEPLPSFSVQNTPPASGAVWVDPSGSVVRPWYVQAAPFGAGLADIPTSVTQKMLLQDRKGDTTAIDNTGAYTIFTLPEPGVYQFRWSLSFKPNPDGRRILELCRESDDRALAQHASEGVPGGTNQIVVLDSGPVLVTTITSYYVTAYQDSGVDVGIIGSAYRSGFSIVRVA